MVGAITLTMGCTGRLPDARFYDGPLSAGVLPGEWVIELQCLQTVESLGFVQFTNQLDHVLLVNPDGTCAYRGFDNYAIPVLWFDRSEVAQHDGFLGEGSRMWPYGVPDAKSWYMWTPSGYTIISGPYEQTNAVVVASNGVMCKNRWTRWSFQDGRTRTAAGFQDDFGTKYRYRIRLSHPTFNAETFFLIGKDEKSLFLWKPVEDRIDSISLIGETIRFRQRRADENVSTACGH